MNSGRPAETWKLGFLGEQSWNVKEDSDNLIRTKREKGQKGASGGGMVIEPAHVVERVLLKEGLLGYLSSAQLMVAVCYGQDGGQDDEV